MGYYLQVFHFEHLLQHLFLQGNTLLRAILHVYLIYGQYVLIFALFSQACKAIGLVVALCKAMPCLSA